MARSTKADDDDDEEQQRAEYERIRLIVGHGMMLPWEELDKEHQERIRKANRAAGF